MKDKDILNSGNWYVDRIIDNAVRTYEGCWVLPENWYDEDGTAWIISLDPDGSDFLPVSKVLWEWENDMEIPDGYEVEHMCSTPGCVNPACQTLWLSTDEL